MRRDVALVERGHLPDVRHGRPKYTAEVEDLHIQHMVGDPPQLESSKYPSSTNAKTAGDAP